MVMLFDRFNLPDNIFETIFATKQQALVAILLIEELKSNGGEIGKTQMSRFGDKLHNGEVTIEVKESEYITKKMKISYNKRQFYDRIVTPMKGMGLIEFDLYKKTYKVSENFTKVLNEIGRMWQVEVRKNAKFKPTS